MRLSKTISAWLRLAAFLVLCGGAHFPLLAFPPLQLHPENPHYFLFRGKPTLLVSSGEHYGAVLNLDFDYRKYLDTLAADHLNVTRTWAGAYCEPPEAFRISHNTLAPTSGRFICPWARSDVPGYANGGNKFDLTKWDPAYFSRLKDFLSRASDHGVVVELNLFCPFYEESMWRLSPMNARNNINEIGAISRNNVYTLDRNGGLLDVQDAMVEKIVTELKDFDNLYYEICNEPYFGGVTLDWQHHIADVIARTERSLGVTHLISRNVANEKAKVDRPYPAVSILNFHYAAPPDTVAMNYSLNRVIGDNETGFRGTNDAPYRIEAWDFIVAGGGLFNNLDYSFTAGHEDGTFAYPATQPGGGNARLRRQFAFLAHTIRNLDFIHMRPDDGILGHSLPPGVSARALVKPGSDYLVYIHTAPGSGKTSADSTHGHFSDQELSLELNLSAGHYHAEWLDPKLESVVRTAVIDHPEGLCQLPVPAFETDIALALRRD